MIALTIQLMIEPARRSYDDATRERLVELFGRARALGGDDAQPGVVPARRAGAGVHRIDHGLGPDRLHYDLELAAAKYLHSLPDGEAPLALHFNGTIYYPGDDGGLQMVLVPWSKSTDFRMPVSVWRETIEHYYPNTGWVALRSQTLEALQREKLRARPADARRVRRASCSRRSTVTDALEQLVDSLLWEGYALYPYTPGGDQERDPDPVRDRLPARVRGRALASTYDHLELRCVLEAPADALLSAEVRFLAPGGERHQARERRGGAAGAWWVRSRSVPASSGRRSSAAAARRSPSS